MIDLKELHVKELFTEDPPVIRLLECFLFQRSERQNHFTTRGFPSEERFTLFSQHGEYLKRELEIDISIETSYDTKGILSIEYLILTL